MLALREKAGQSCPREHVRVKRVYVKDAKGNVRVVNK